MRLLPNIILIGFMGCGKSTLAKLLAQRLGRQRIDTDALIETQQGRSIADIFKNNGEDYFRNLETRILLVETLQCNVSTNKMGYRPSVIACGGGIVLRSQNRVLLRRLGLVIHIDAPLEVLWERVSRDQSRPLAKDRGAFLQRYEERLPLYRGLADITVVSDGRPALAVLWELLEKTSRFGVYPLRS